MKSLAIELDIPKKEVDETFRKHCPDTTPTQKANRELLKKWKNCQNSREEVYINLVEAFEKGLNYIAAEVLFYRPVVVPNRYPCVSQITSYYHRETKTKHYRLETLC